MADSIYSTDIQVWVDLLNANWAKIEQIIASRARTPSQLELVDTMSEFHTLLVNYRQDGVDKMQRATINAFVKKIDVDLRRIIDDVDVFLAAAREAEQIRANNETVRETAEDDRDSAETTRRNNEVTRQNQEGVRVGQESDRQTAEATRVTNWNDFFGATADAGVRKTWSDWFSDTLAAGVRRLWNDFWPSVNTSWNAFWGTSASDPNGVRKQWSDLHSQATSDHTQATTDHTNALAATTGAENVNAELSGFTVTITNRQGTSSSVDIGFETYRTYTSVSDMNADASNVPQGKFVVIATVSPTDPDNAKMYCKNSQGGFTFLCDLDQASAEAWAEWLNTQKPAIEQATSDANDAAALANTKAALADEKATLANNKATIADQKATLADQKATYAQAQGDYAKNLADHPSYIGNDNYWYIWSYASQAYVKDAYAKGDDLHWDEMTEQEKEDLAEKVRDEIVFATEQTCMDLITELQ